MVNGGDRLGGQPDTTELKGVWPPPPEQHSEQHQGEFRPLENNQVAPPETSNKPPERRIEIERMKDVLKNIEFILAMRIRLIQLVDLNQIDLVVLTLQQMRRTLPKEQMSDNDFEAFIQYLLHHHEKNNHDSSVGNVALARRKLNGLMRPAFEFSAVPNR